VDYLLFMFQGSWGDERFRLRRTFGGAEWEGECVIARSGRSPGGKGTEQSDAVGVTLKKG